MEIVIQYFVKGCTLEIAHYLESHEESLWKHPLKTLAESVADALSLARPRHVDESFLTKALSDRLGLRFATLYNIALENVAMLQSEIKTYLTEVTHLLAPVATNIITKTSANYQRLHSIILQVILH
ncbi:hypothetical protein EGW08_013964 [Elysia chlorotica]|uniref:Uncharacterized protein n=1 Tax=Elysia chlorotica TaxID=188477 RepID=A0A3S0ZMB4_ELYCH|nr:hypothetical protein EGW08_013964 [Elysia chlorotica]